MLDSFFGLPLHPLIVHATVVVVPTAALVCVLAAVNARFRAWAGVLPAALAVLGLVLVPLSTSSGQELQNHIGESELIKEHSGLANFLIWWMVPLAVLAVGAFLLRRRGTTSGTLITRVVPALTVLVALGALVQVALIGHSGATALWKGTVEQSAPAGQGGG